jgi:hypothetical protein
VRWTTTTARAGIAQVSAKRMMRAALAVISEALRV